MDEGGYERVTMGLQWAYNGVTRVTRGYKRVTRGLQGAYKGEVTMGLGAYKGVKNVTRGYKGLQGFTRVTRG